MEEVGKDRYVRRIDLRPASVTNVIMGGTGGRAVAGEADMVDGYHAAGVATPGYLLALNDSAWFPSSVYPNAVLIDGTRALTANWDAGSYAISSGTLKTDTLAERTADQGIAVSDQLKLAADAFIQIRDAEIKISSSADGYIKAEADVAAQVVAPTVQLVATTLTEVPSGPLRIGASHALQFGSDVALQRAGADVLQLATGDALRSGNFASGISGWDVAADGTAEFNHVWVRGEIHAATFVKDLIQAHAGTMIVAKSAGTLHEDMVVPGAGTWSMKIDDPPGGGFLFDNSDICRCKTEYAGGVAEVWYTVSARVDNGDGTQSYTCTYNSGTQSITYPAGATVIDYGVSGDGFLLMTAELSNAPYYAVATHAGSPWSTQTIQARLGNLNGSYGYGSDVFGGAFGEYASGKANITIDPTNGIRVRSYTVTKVQIQADGDVFIGTDVSAAATTNIVIFTNAQTYNSESMEVGDLLLGDNSASHANILWDSSAGQLKFRGGTTTESYIDTDGSFVAGYCKMVATGVEIEITTSDQTARAYKFYDDVPNLAGALYAYRDPGGATPAHRLLLKAEEVAGDRSLVRVWAEAPTALYASTELVAQSGSQLAYVLVSSNDITGEQQTEIGGNLKLGYYELWIGDYENDDVTVGITINQGNYDDHVMSFQSTDVGHTGTSIAEADAFGFIKKSEGTSGGLLVVGLKDSAGAAGYALALQGILDENADTTKTTAGIGIVDIFACQIDSGSHGNVVADGNILSIRTKTGGSIVTKFLFDVEGSAHSDTEWTTFQDEDDLALLNTLEQVMVTRDPLTAEMGRFLEHGRRELERLGIAHFDDRPGHAMVNWTRLAMLLVGNARQLGAQIADMKLQLAS